MSLIEPTSVSDIRYKCPVCFKALFPPVFQCQNGHLLCGACIPQLENCPVCRVSLIEIIGSVRNLEVERIIRMIEHPCPNEYDGCDAIVKFDEMEDHRLECIYTKFPICKDIMGLDCEEIRITDYAEHSERVHQKKFVDLRRKTLPVTRRSSVTRFQRNTWFAWRFHFLFEGKPTLVILTARHNRESDLVTWKPYILAGVGVTNQVKMMTESPIFNLQTKPADLEACWSVPFKYLQTLFRIPSVNNADPEFRFSFEISKKAAKPGPEDETD